MNLDIVKKNYMLFFPKRNLWLYPLKEDLLGVQKTYFKIWNIYDNNNPKTLKSIRVDFFKQGHLSQQTTLDVWKNNLLKLKTICYYNHNQRCIQKHQYQIDEPRSARYSETVSYYNNFGTLFKTIYYVYHLPSNKIFSQKIETDFISNHQNRGQSEH